MSRNKLKALTFGDYGVNLLASLLGIIAFSFIFNFSFGSYLYSIIFCFTLFLFIYYRGSTAAKIDLRTNEESLKKAFELAMPLAASLICIIAVYSLFYYDILPAKTVVIKSTVLKDGNTVSLYLFDIISVFIRMLFFNITGFAKNAAANPLLLLISPGVVVLSTFSGYYFGMKKIYISEYLIKAKNFIISKFNE